MANYIELSAEETISTNELIGKLPITVEVSVADENEKEGEGEWQ